MGRKSETAAGASEPAPIRGQAAWCCVRCYSGRCGRLRALVAALLVLAGLIAVARPAAAESRTALIAVAADYQRLRRADLDVAVFRRLAATLARQGFKVHESYNERGSFLRAKLARFANDARSADVAVALLAGHFASSDRLTFFLPVETEIESASDIFLGGLPTRSFLAAVAPAGRGAVARLATYPALPDHLTGLVSTPRIEADTAPGVALATSAAITNASAKLDERAHHAARVLTRELDDGGWDLRRFAEAVAGGDADLIIGDLPPSNQDREAEERRRRDVENRKRKERERLAAEAAERKAAEEEARVAAAKRAEAENRAARLRKRADEEARARAEAERRASETAARLAKLEADFRALKAREEQVARLADQAKAAEAAHQTAEKKAREAQDQTAEANAALAETKRRAAAREAKLASELAALKSRLDEIRAAEETKKAAPKPETSSTATAPPSPPVLQPSKYKIAFLRRMDSLLRPDQRQKIQAKLKARGLLAADAPSAFDAQTRDAIRSYQISTGAEPTGYLTPPQFLKLITE